jgi:Family of unknown function (DUF5719)
MTFSCARSLGAGLAVACVTLATSLTPAAVPAASAQTVNGALPTPLPLFPPDNWWNVNVSAAPLDTKSASFISFIGTTRRLHADMGGSAHDPTDPQQIYGLPYIVVPGTQKLVPVTFRYSGESDKGAPGRPAGYPIPEQVKTQAGWMEGGAPAGSTSTLDSNRGDRHMLIVDKDNKILYELFSVKWNNTAKRWEAGSGAVWPLTSNYRRPEGWTSADASGMAILPGLIRYDEAFGTAAIKHALRVTVRATNGYVYPASHKAGSTTGALPMGARLRLKSTVNISSYPAHVQKIFQAMKTYGLIVADNGSDMFIQGTSDPRWESKMDSIQTAFRSLNAGMFQVVKLGWKPTTPTTPPPSSSGVASETLEANAVETPDAIAVAGQSADAMVVEPSVEQSSQTSGAFRRYFAEGATNSALATRFTVMNPGEAPASVQFTFLTADGKTVTHAESVAARGQVTLDPASVKGLEQGAYSTVVESDVDVVVDRDLEGQHSPGSAEAGTRWGFADGGAQTFILIANTSAQAGDARVTLRFEDGREATKTYALPANSRTTVQVATDFPAAANGKHFGAIVESVGDQPAAIVVERTIYTTIKGAQTLGSNATATRLSDQP